ncbi:hypothetical protein [Hippea alviniae]|uniref:hypothetical protein n=1 Tax=Hippea alviniae TaxID=1279027 RepID=UPI0012DE2287|nr:hypothetical protein [Hippea alviniae]
MKGLRVLASLLALLTLISISNAADINNIFNAYKNRDVKLCFKQVSINGMTGQKIEKDGILFIKAKKEMIFDYGNEKILIDNFKAVDVKGKTETVYKLTGFNKVLFLMFLGKKELSDLFNIKESDNGTFELLPKYESSIDNVIVRFFKDSVKEIKITDIYANKTIYYFHALPCKRTSQRDKAAN